MCSSHYNWSRSVAIRNVNVDTALDVPFYEYNNVDDYIPISKYRVVTHIQLQGWSDNINHIFNWYSPHI